MNSSSIEDDPRVKPKLAIEGTNYALVEKKKTAVGEYRLEWGKKRFLPVRENTLDTASKEIRSKISPFVRHSFTAITRNNRLLIVEYIYILMEMMGFARQTFPTFDFLVRANFLSIRKHEVIAYLDRNGTSLAITSE